MKNQLPIPTEYDECVLFAKYLRLLVYQGKVIKFCHIPEMHTKSHAQRSKNTMQGFNAGIPDYVIILNNKKVLWIEMKRTRGSSTSDEQYAWQEALNDAGCVSEICYGFYSAKTIVEDNLSL